MPSFAMPTFHAITLSERRLFNLAQGFNSARKKQPQPIATLNIM